jgi:hypothetical protein
VGSVAKFDVDEYHRKRKAEEEQLLIAQAEMIRGLTQGPGFLNHDYRSEVPEGVLESFESEDRSELMDRMHEGLELMLDGPYKLAISNALGEGWYAKKGGNTLTERREWFMKKKSSITARTLIRHEQEGAYILASMMKNAKERSTVTKKALLERVIDLERVVDALIEINSDLRITLGAYKSYNSEALTRAVSLPEREWEPGYTKLLEDSMKKVNVNAIVSIMNVLDPHEEEEDSTPSTESQRDQD